MTRKFGPLSKTELYLQEDDFLDRANVVVIKQKIKWIDLEKKQITFAGNTQRIEFDKVLLSCGSTKQRLKKEYSNVYYMEDS